MLIRAAKGLATILIGAWCFPWVGVCRAQRPAGGGAQQPELARPHVVVYVRSAGEQLGAGQPDADDESIVAADDGARRPGQL
jgi:hypothetical protein